MDEMTLEQQRAEAEARARMVQAQNSDSLSQLRTMTGGVLEGIPVVGPMIRGGVERAAAATIAPFSDETYSQVLDRIQKGSEAEKAANPGLNMGSQITGAVAGTVPMVLAAPEAFGAGDAPLWLRSVISGLTGGTIGGTDAAVRSGGNPSAALNGLEWGAGLGLAAPGVGSLLGAGTRALASRFGPQLSSAEKLFGSALNRDAVTNPGASLSDLGPQAMPMDLGPNLQRQAGALAATPGEAQGIVRGAIGARDAGANARIQGAVDQTLGPAPALQNIDAQISANMDALGPEYGKAFANAKAVDTTRIANDLESKVVNLRGSAQKAAQDVRKMLNITGTDTLDPNPGTLFQVRQAIDGKLATEADPKAVRLLTETRKAVDNLLAMKVPGIKKLDARFAELARQKEAVQRGMQALDSGRTAPRPSELATEFQEGALPQGDTFGPSAVPLRLREGARAEIDRIIGTNANDRVALQRLIKGEGDWNRARLATLFGQDRADKIINVLDRERAFADTSDVVTRNSETTARTAAQGEIAPAKQPGFIREALNLRFGSAAADLGDKVIGNATDAARQARNAELARLLTTNDPKNAGRIMQLTQAAKNRGDLTAEQVKQIGQSLVLASSQRRRPLEITVSPGRF